MTTPELFIRYRFAWLAYAGLFVFAYLQVILSPIMPFLREELQISYTLGGLHATMFAAGSVIASFISPVLIRRFGRQHVFWWGITGMFIGALLLASAPHVVFTLGSVLLMAIAGVSAMVIITAGLVDLYGSQSTIALSEANVTASVGATIVPLLVGWLAATGIGWRAAFGLPALLLAVMLWTARHDPVPGDLPRATARATVSSPRRRVRLPVAFWLFWMVLMLGVAVEWSVALWAADLLIAARGVAPETAALLVSFFFGAMLLGRIVGSRLAHHTASDQVLLLSLLVAGLGVPIFWLAPNLVLGLVGLVITGLGIGNFFPMGLSAAMGTVSEHIDVASAQALLAGGVAMLFAPFLLGALADVIGIQGAFASVPVLVLVMLVMLVIARQQGRRAATPPATYSEPVQ
ncbi:MAG: MFS transporter [Chloroflexaceae bacterium]|nr:MFS transporter [Chloroflexaceae bacterium]